MPIHVLYVDDDPDMSYLCEMHLTGQGYAVTCASQGQAALDVLVAQRIDIVVADFHMPIYSGPELARLIAQSFPDVPVVLTSAFVNDARAQEARAAGAMALVEKAPDSGPLLGCLANLPARPTNQPAQAQSE